MTTIHHYDAVSGEHLGSGEARLDPVEQQPLVPRNATMTPPPPALAGHAVCFRDGGWQQVEDHRGKTAYATADGAPRVLSELGPVPEGYTLLPPGAFQVWDEAAGTWVDDPDAERAAQAAACEAELHELDRWLPRSVEDLIDAGAVPETALSDYNQTRLARKRQLRAELATLAGGGS